MLLTIGEMRFIADTTYEDKNGHRRAKHGLSKAEKKKLLDIDDVYFLTHGNHFVENYKEIDDK